MHLRKRRRWSIYDYGTDGYYFITICTQNRVPYFGRMKSIDEIDICEMYQSLYLTPSESLEANEYNTEINPENSRQLLIELARQNNPFIVPSDIGLAVLKCWLDIPNHFPDAQTHEFILMDNHLHGVISLKTPFKEKWETPKFGPHTKDLFSIVRGFKIGVTLLARKNTPSFSWHKGYYDRVVRNEAEHESIRTYLHQNPANWFLNHVSRNLIF